MGVTKKQNAPNISKNEHFLPPDKAKGRISKHVLQENKARHILQKTNISYPLIGTCTYVYQGVRNNCFSENLLCFEFL